MRVLPLSPRTFGVEHHHADNRDVVGEGAEEHGSVHPASIHTNSVSKAIGEPGGPVCWPCNSVVYNEDIHSEKDVNGAGLTKSWVYQLEFLQVGTTPVQSD